MACLALPVLCRSCGDFGCCPRRWDRTRRWRQWREFESSQSVSNNSGGGRRAAWFTVPADGLRRPRRAAPPLIVAALAGMTRRGCPAGPHCDTRAHRSGAQTMGSERGRGSRPSEQRGDGLAVGAHPPPPAWWPPPPGLHWPPTPPLGTPSHARSPHFSSRPSGISIRQGARRQCAWGKPSRSPNCLATRGGAVPSTSPLPRRCPFSPPY
jgi:hypothetical protein